MPATGAYCNSSRSRGRHRATGSGSSSEATAEVAIPCGRLEPGNRNLGNLFSLWVDCLFSLPCKDLRSRLCRSARGLQRDAVVRLQHALLLLMQLLPLSLPPLFLLGPSATTTAANIASTSIISCFFFLHHQDLRSMPVLSAGVDTTLPSSDGVYRHGFDAFPSWDLRSWLGAVNPPTSHYKLADSMINCR